MRRIACGLALLFLALTGCHGYEVEVTIYDPDRAYNGYTFFNSRSDKRILGVDMEGEIHWNLQVFDRLWPGDMDGFELQDDGTLLFIQYGVPLIMDLSDYSIVFEGAVIGGHHDVTMTPMQTILCPTREGLYVEYEPWWPFNTLVADVISELDMATNEVIWEWHLGDYIDPIEHHHESIEVIWGDATRDWSHVNTVQYIPDYVFDGNTYDAVLFNSRHLNTFWVIDHATGDILWSCGEHGMFGFPGPGEELLFSHSHQVELLSNGNVIMYDNGNDRVPPSSRALELSVDPVAQVAQEVWSWTEPGMYDYWGGDANKLPNGNVLLTNVEGGRIIEVTPSGEIVWEMHMKRTIGPNHTIYSCTRIPYE
jgi:hypothetical protein